MDTRRKFLQGSAGGTLAALGVLAGPAPTVAAESADAGPDVGSLYPFVKSQAVAGEFPLSFLQKEFTDVPTWKTRARQKLLDLLHYAPRRYDPRAEVVARVDRGDYVEERIAFNTTPDIRVPAFVLVPKKTRGPAPGIVALHDHGGFYMWGKEKLVELPGEHPALTAFKSQLYGGRSIASELARAGYVVAVIDMFYWGERRMLLADDAADWRDRGPSLTKERLAAFDRRASESEQLVARSVEAAGFTWPGVMFWDDIRTLDYLASRPEVDASRLGCVGLSVGAVRSLHLAALDDRIKAAVVVGWMTSFPSQLERRVRNSIGFTKLVPGLYRHLDYPDVGSLAMPRPLLVINGSRDALFEPAGVRAAFEKLAACYRKAGVPERVQTRLYDTPHEFNLEMQREAWAFLETHLRRAA
jgi:dienelactone hydrolase